MAKGLNLNFRKFWGLIPTLVEVTGQNTGSGGGECSLYKALEKLMIDQRVHFFNDLCPSYL